MNKKNKIENLCNYPDCELEGGYRAPKSYDNLNDYQWFCLDHIKEFNKKWDYHKQMGADEIETDIRFDTIWRRPTHSFGSGKKFFDFNINGEDMGSFENPSKSTSSSNKLHWSLSELELDINTDINLIKKNIKNW